jgi:hypothetical protein
VSKALEKASKGVAACELEANLHHSPILYVVSLVAGSNMLELEIETNLGKPGALNFS